MNHKVKCIYLDVDGVLTDGTKSYYDDGRVSKVFHDHDSYGLKFIMNKGVNVLLISADKRVNETWAKHQNIPFIQSENKINVLKESMFQLNLKKEECSFIGDDLRDLDCIKYVKYSMAPFNAHNIVKEHAWKVLSKTGGSGAVREAIEELMALNKVTYDI